MFQNEFDAVNYKNSDENLIKSTNTGGYSAILGYRYLFIGADAIQHKFKIDTAEKEEIIVSYNTIGIGFFLHYHKMVFSPYIGYGKGKVECVSECKTTYDTPLLHDYTAYGLYTGVKLSSWAILTIGFKTINAEDFENKASQSGEASMVLKSTNLNYTSIGLLFDF